LTEYPVETVVAWGDAGRALCAMAVELDAGVIVVGSRGLGGVKRLFLGSVSTHVVQNAPCAVLVVPDPGDD
jgi:nucleotide-binding universal stress UspA family protein